MMEQESPSPSWKSVPQKSSRGYFLKRWLNGAVSKVPQNPKRHIKETKEEILFDIAEYAEIRPFDLLLKLDSRWGKLTSHLRQGNSFRGISLRTAFYNLSEDLRKYRVIIEGYRSKNQKEWYFICFDTNEKREFSSFDKLLHETSVRTLTEAGYPISFTLTNNAIISAEIEHCKCDEESAAHQTIIRKAREYWGDISNDLRCKVPGLLEFVSCAPFGDRTITHAEFRRRNYGSLNKYFDTSA